MPDNFTHQRETPWELMWDFTVYVQDIPISLEELCNVTPLASLGLLYKDGWALGNESVDLHYHLLQQSMSSP